MSTHMTNMNISIRKEAYDFLSRLKSDNKSFSDVILDFKTKDEGVMKFFGVLKDIDWKAKEASMKEFRGSFNNKLK